MIDYQGSRDDAVGVQEYLRLRPIGVRALFEFYIAFGRYALKLFEGRRPRTLGECVHGRSNLLIRSGRLTFEARPRTEDVGYLTPHHKRAVSRWFSPSKGETVVDVGAHVGYFSLVAGREGARVFSFEPSLETYRILKRNIARNQLDLVLAFNVALGAESGGATLRTPGHFGGLASFHEPMISDDVNVVAEHVEMVTLDSVEEVRHLRNVDWLLIDTEGWEVNVLRGARQTLAKTRRLIVEVEHGKNAELCEDLILGSGFSIKARERQSEVNDYWFCIQS